MFKIFKAKYLEIRNKIFTSIVEIILKQWIISWYIENLRNKNQYYFTYISLLIFTKALLHNNYIILSKFFKFSKTLLLVIWLSKNRIVKLI